MPWLRRGEDCDGLVWMRDDSSIGRRRSANLFRLVQLLIPPVELWQCAERSIVTTLGCVSFVCSHNILCVESELSSSKRKLTSELAK